MWTCQVHTVYKLSTLLGRKLLRKSPMLLMGKLVMSSNIISLFPGFVDGLESQQLLTEYIKLYAVWLFM